MKKSSKNRTATIRLSERKITVATQPTREGARYLLSLPVDAGREQIEHGVRRLLCIYDDESMILCNLSDPDGTVRLANFLRTHPNPWKVDLAEEGEEGREHQAQPTAKAGGDT